MSYSKNVEFENLIKKWIDLDNYIKIENEKMKKIKDEKNKINDNILQFANDNNLLKANIELNDSDIKFITNKTTQTLSIKYIHKCLCDVIQDNDKVEKIINYIKENRENKINLEIKRTYK
jgi:hypothetical protein